MVEFCVGGESRLLEVQEPLTVAEVRALFGFEGELFYEHAGNAFAVLNDCDLQVASSLGPTVKLTTTTTTGNKKTEESNEILERAVATLQRFGFGEVDAGELKRLVDALVLPLLRLVKCSLAEVSRSKCRGRNDDDEVNSLVFGDMRLDSKEEMDDASSVENNFKMEQLEEDAIVKAFRLKGVTTMAPGTIHSVVRILQVPLPRFIKLGIVEDETQAKAALSHGARLAHHHLRSNKTLFLGRQGQMLKDALEGRATKGKFLFGRPHGKRQGGPGAKGGKKGGKGRNSFKGGHRRLS